MGIDLKEVSRRVQPLVSERKEFIDRIYKNAVKDLGLTIDNLFAMSDCTCGDNDEKAVKFHFLFTATDDNDEDIYFRYTQKMQYSEFSEEAASKVFDSFIFDLFLDFTWYLKYGIDDPNIKGLINKSPDVKFTSKRYK